ncbi:hypothetical protein [Allofournierella sp. CML151]|uniref:hypothetical protein n=1 Tax=Allofournierella sp. CML151 TaxID=2998082 RepID=UPI0022EB7DB7|nr:hypothetical protein [Fournierella sp. CML151]
MIQLLIDLLTPIFTSMGVSTTDVQTYVNMLSGYIYTIIGLLAVAIIVMVAVHFLVKKGNTSRGALERGTCLGSGRGHYRQHYVLWSAL